MEYYIIQTVVFQLLFLIVYDLFLKKETFFNWNRVYLLSTAILSLVLPFIKIESFKTIVSQEFIETLPVILIKEQDSEITQQVSNTIYTETYSLSVLEWTLYIGISIATLLFLVKLTRLFLLIYKNPKRWKGDLLLIKLLNSNAAFSFFHYIFLGEQLKEYERSIILNHEAIHVKQKHSIDLMFFEVMRILFWFNPLVYIYQNRIISLHEFIVDSKVIKSTNKENYYQDLLSQVFETRDISFINTFYKSSLIKTRIDMLSRVQSKRILKLKYLLLVPIVFGMLLYTSCENETLQTETSEILELSELPFATIVGRADSNNTKEFKELRNQQQDFLMNNFDYALWQFTDYNKNEITSSIIHKDEITSKDYNSKGTITINNSNTYIIYGKSIGDPPNTVYISSTKETP